jgi:DNA relaxase NicK
VDCVLALFLARQNRQQARSDLEQQDQKQEKARRETNRVLSNLNAQNEGVPSTCFFVGFRKVRNYIKVYSKRGYMFNQKIGPKKWSNPIPMISND